MNDNFYFKLEKRKYTLSGLDAWIVSGWYQDEKDAYKIAETEWEKNRPNGPIVYITVNDLVDDHFSWNVVTPHWYLHQDGKWRKSLSSGEKRTITGEFPTEELAEKAMMKGIEPNWRPARFENYQEHLASSAPAINFQYSEEEKAKYKNMPGFIS